MPVAPYYRPRTMNTKTLLSLALLLLPTPLLAQQNAANLKKELRTKEAAAKKDPEALFETAKWAAAQALDADAKRLFEKVLKISPDHKGANEAMGNELVEGKWLPAKEAEKARLAAQAAEFAAKGLVEVDGIWVKPDEVEDAKRGVYHHEKELVTRQEKVAFLQGMVRHPETSLLIDAKFLEKAQSGYFPIGDDGRWVDLAEADKYHSELLRPWIVSYEYGHLVSSLPLKTLQELKVQADQGHERVAPLFGGRAPLPAKRPVVIIAKSQGDYQSYGKELGDGTDAGGSFLMRREARFKMPMQGDVRAGICYNEKDFGTRYVRHAAALAYANALAEEQGVQLPLWFLHGVGSLASRFDNDSDAGWFGKQQLARGGVGDLKAFFSSFAISADMEPQQISGNLFTAGLLLSFAMRTKDKNVLAAMTGVTDALAGKTKDADKAIERLEKQLVGARDAVLAHLQELIAKAP